MHESPSERKPRWSDVLDDLGLDPAETVMPASAPSAPSPAPPRANIEDVPEHATVEEETHSRGRRRRLHSAPEPVVEEPASEPAVIEEPHSVEDERLPVESVEESGEGKAEPRKRRRRRRRKGNGERPATGVTAELPAGEEH